MTKCLLYQEVRDFLMEKLPSRTIYRKRGHMQSTLSNSLISAQPCMQMFLSDKVFLKSLSLTGYWQNAKLGAYSTTSKQH